ncbi:hypothetical protein ACFTXM_30850 [Streptomyces sp. NPDC056930]|uniref:hypothetical protein n=1 Tax=Streptomyces sp. NPDC056930 TaxID=3345967 RepID=UPI0036369570
MINVAIIGTMEAVMTADSQTALSVTSSTPKASATGDMALPALEIDQPVKNHRKAGERSGRPDARLVLDASSASVLGGSRSRFSGASVSGTRGDAAGACRIHQAISGVGDRRRAPARNRHDRCRKADRGAMTCGLTDARPVVTG